MNTVFHVDNKHVESCGTPPNINGNEQGDYYYGYFENPYGEQLVFVYDHTTKSGTLWVGDAGWEHSYPVIGGEAQGIILGTMELAWLSICWMTVSK